MANSISEAIGRRLASFLTKAQQGYQRFDTVSAADVAAVLQPGDIVLVDGNTRISTAVKFLTQSSWSHACLYIGKEGDPPSEALLIEADLKDGVRLVSLDQYGNFNLRICRPVGLKTEDVNRLIAFAKLKLGHQYDLRNVFDLIRYVIQKPAVPNRYRRAMIGFGSGEPTRAICSTLIAESFQEIDYPILPRREGGNGFDGKVPQYYKRHFTHFTPRDFDLSPYFEVVKPTLIEDFDFHSLKWRIEAGTVAEGN
jgi:hypothetical protein|tara:strand:+ start:2174 stop:2935 length:762 start_codon:yes stop_codon:yes gene_type:complete